MNDKLMLDRRELLKRAAYLIGGTISAPAVFGVLQGCTPKKPEGEWTPEFLSAAQGALVAEVAEIMIPRTNTPGAKDVGVPAFIDLMLKDVYPKQDQERYLSGLQEFEERAQQAHGKSFVALDSQQRSSMVREAHDAAIETPSKRESRPFILMTKELTMLGFFTSEAGATQVLQYEAVPGPYLGCIPLSDAGNGKAWAVEASSVF